MTDHRRTLWATTSLGELGSFVSGQSLPATKLNSTGSGTPYISGPEQWSGTSIQVTQWTEATVRVAPANSIFIVVKGQGGVGKIFPGMESAIGRNLVAFVPHSPLSRDYISLVLSSQERDLRERARGHIPGLTIAQLRAIPISLPPHAEQLRMVDVAKKFSLNVDKVKIQAAASVSALEAVQQATLQRVVKYGRLRAEDPVPGLTASNADRGVSLGPSVNSSLPAGWVWTRLSDVAELQTGHTPSRRVPEYWSGSIPWLGIPDARDHDRGIVHATRQQISQSGLDNSSAKLLPTGSVCLCRTAASIGYVVALGRPMATSQDFANWICGDRIHPTWLRWLLVSEREKLVSFGKGSTHKTIYFEDLRQIYVSLPPIEDQEWAAELLEDKIPRSSTLAARLQSVSALIEIVPSAIRKSAISGQFDTSDPSDEPAALLLSRLDKQAPIRQEKRVAIREDPHEGTSVERLRSAVSDADGGLTPEEAFSVAGYSHEAVDEFFRDLQSLVEANSLAYDRQSDLIRMST